jgi:hypothetical protein
MGKKQSGKNPASAPQSPVPLRRSLRLVISVVLILHLVVVIATPMGIVIPASQLAREIIQYAGPYLQAGNVSHGYAFFAPDPGPGHIIDYELSFPDGHTEQGTIPDLQEHWPRLRYHRHFMLTEQLASLHEDEPLRPADSRYDQEWKQMHDRWTLQNRDFERRATSYGHHLLNTTGASQVEMHLIRHHQASREDILGGGSLQDPKLYETGRVITVTAGERP